MELAELGKQSGRTVVYMCAMESSSKSQASSSSSLSPLMQSVKSSSQSASDDEGCLKSPELRALGIDLEKQFKVVGLKFEKEKGDVWVKIKTGVKSRAKSNKAMKDMTTSASRVEDSVIANVKVSTNSIAGKAKTSNVMTRSRRKQHAQGRPKKPQPGSDDESSSVKVVTVDVHNSFDAEPTSSQSSAYGSPIFIDDNLVETVTVDVSSSADDMIRRTAFSLTKSSSSKSNSEEVQSNLNENEVEEATVCEVRHTPSTEKKNDAPHGGADSTDDKVVKPIVKDNTTNSPVVVVQGPDLDMGEKRLRCKSVSGSDTIMRAPDQKSKEQDEEMESYLSNEKPMTEIELEVKKLTDDILEKFEAQPKDISGTVGLCVKSNQLPNKELKYTINDQSLPNPSGFATGDATKTTHHVYHHLEADLDNTNEHSVDPSIDNSKVKEPKHTSIDDVPVLYRPCTRSLDAGESRKGNKTEKGYFHMENMDHDGSHREDDSTQVHQTPIDISHYCKSHKRDSPREKGVVHAKNLELRISNSSANSNTILCAKKNPERKPKSMAKFPIVCIERNLIDSFSTASIERKNVASPTCQGTNPGKQSPPDEALTSPTAKATGGNLKDHGLSNKLEGHEGNEPDFLSPISRITPSSFNKTRRRSSSTSPSSGLEISPYISRKRIALFKDFRPGTPEKRLSKFEREKLREEFLIHQNASPLVIPQKEKAKASPNNDVHPKLEKESRKVARKSTHKHSLVQMGIDGKTKCVRRKLGKGETSKSPSISTESYSDSEEESEIPESSKSIGEMLDDLSKTMTSALEMQKSLDAHHQLQENVDTLERDSPPKGSEGKLVSSKKGIVTRKGKKRSRPSRTGQKKCKRNTIQPVISNEVRRSGRNIREYKGSKPLGLNTMVLPPYLSRTSRPTSAALTVPMQSFSQNARLQKLKPIPEEDQSRSRPSHPMSRSPPNQNSMEDNDVQSATLPLKQRILRTYQNYKFSHPETFPPVFSPNHPHLHASPQRLHTGHMKTPRSLNQEISYPFQMPQTLPVQSQANIGVQGPILDHLTTLDLQSGMQHRKRMQDTFVSSSQVGPRFSQGVAQSHTQQIPTQSEIPTTILSLAEQSGSYPPGSQPTYPKQMPVRLSKNASKHISALAVPAPLAGSDSSSLNPQAMTANQIVTNTQQGFLVPFSGKVLVQLSGSTGHTYYTYGSHVFVPNEKFPQQKSADGTTESFICSTIFRSQNMAGYKKAKNIFPTESNFLQIKGTSPQPGQDLNKNRGFDTGVSSTDLTDFIQKDLDEPPRKKPKPTCHPCVEEHTNATFTFSHERILDNKKESSSVGKPITHQVSHVQKPDDFAENASDDQICVPHQTQKYDVTKTSHLLQQPNSKPVPAHTNKSLHPFAKLNQLARQMPNKSMYMLKKLDLPKADQLALNKRTQLKVNLKQFGNDKDSEKSGPNSLVPCVPLLTLNNTGRSDPMLTYVPLGSLSGFSNKVKSGVSVRSSQENFYTGKGNQVIGQLIPNVEGAGRPPTQRNISPCTASIEGKQLTVGAGSVNFRSSHTENLQASMHSFNPGSVRSEIARNLEKLSQQRQEACGILDIILKSSPPDPIMGIQREALTTSPQILKATLEKTPPLCVIAGCSTLPPTSPGNQDQQQNDEIDQQMALSTDTSTGIDDTDTLSKSAESALDLSTSSWKHIASPLIPLPSPLDLSKSSTVPPLQEQIPAELEVDKNKEMIDNSRSPKNQDQIEQPDVTSHNTPELSDTHSWKLTGGPMMEETEVSCQDDDFNLLNRILHCEIGTSEYLKQKREESCMDTSDQSFNNSQSEKSENTLQSAVEENVVLNKKGQNYSHPSSVTQHENTGVLGLFDQSNISVPWLKSRASSESEIALDLSRSLQHEERSPKQGRTTPVNWPALSLTEDSPGLPTITAKDLDDQLGSTDRTQVLCLEDLESNLAGSLPQVDMTMEVLNSLSNSGSAGVVDEVLKLQDAIREGSTTPGEFHSTPMMLLNDSMQIECSGKIESNTSEQNIFLESTSKPTDQQSPRQPECSKDKSTNPMHTWNSLSETTTPIRKAPCSHRNTPSRMLRSSGKSTPQKEAYESGGVSVAAQLTPQSPLHSTTASDKHNEFGCPSLNTRQIEESSAEIDGNNLLPFNYESNEELIQDISEHTVMDQTEPVASPYHQPVMAEDMSYHSLAADVYCSHLGGDTRRVNQSYELPQTHSRFVSKQSPALTQHLNLSSLPAAPQSTARPSKFDFIPILKELGIFKSSPLTPNQLQHLDRLHHVDCGYQQQADAIGLDSISTHPQISVTPADSRIQDKSFSSTLSTGPRAISKQHKLMRRQKRNNSKRRIASTNDDRRHRRDEKKRQNKEHYCDASLVPVQELSRLTERTETTASMIEEGRRQANETRTQSPCGEATLLQTAYSMNTSNTKSTDNNRAENEFDEELPSTQNLCNAARVKRKNRERPGESLSGSRQCPTVKTGQENAESMTNPYNSNGEDDDVMIIPHDDAISVLSIQSTDSAKSLEARADIEQSKWAMGRPWADVKERISKWFQSISTAGRSASAESIGELITTKATTLTISTSSEVDTRAVSSCASTCEMADNTGNELKAFDSDSISDGTIIIHHAIHNINSTVTQNGESVRKENMKESVQIEDSTSMGRGYAIVKKGEPLISDMPVSPNRQKKSPTKQCTRGSDLLPRVCLQRLSSDVLKKWLKP